MNLNRNLTKRYESYLQMTTIPRIIPHVLIEIFGNHFLFLTLFLELIIKICDIYQLRKCPVMKLNIYNKFDLNLKIDK